MNQNVFFWKMVSRFLCPGHSTFKSISEFTIKLLNELGFPKFEERKNWKLKTDIQKWKMKLDFQECKLIVQIEILKIKFWFFWNAK